MQILQIYGARCAIYWIRRSVWLWAGLPDRRRTGSFLRVYHHICTPAQSPGAPYPISGGPVPPAPAYELKTNQRRSPSSSLSALGAAAVGLTAVTIPVQTGPVQHSKHFQNIRGCLNSSNWNALLLGSRLFFLLSFVYYRFAKKMGIVEI